MAALWVFSTHWVEAYARFTTRSRSHYGTRAAHTASAVSVMTVAPGVEAEIRRLFFAEHWKRGTIASQLGVHPDVVTRVIGPLGRKAHPERPDTRVLEPFLPWVDETLARYPRLVSTRLYDMLRERGYQGSVRTLRRYVQDARPRPKTEAFLRLQTLPGEQARSRDGEKGGRDDV